ncbi:MAG: DUF1800 domain-containing protein [Ferruginibacter sp.]
MAVSNRTKNQHLLSRAGFGPMAEFSTELETMPQKELWQLLLKGSSKVPEKMEVTLSLADGLLKGIKDIVDLEKLSKEQKKAIRDKSQEDLKSLNLLWIEQMVNSEAQLLEKLSLFWHGHFACRVVNIYFQQELIDIIRANALGNFGDLLRAVSKSPAMLSFLNNQQNRKRQPNENFAREVMELFTMGRGNYREADIKEAARAFTGWGFTLQGEFEFRENVHDDGEKTVLGKTGNFDGDDIIDLLLEQPQTAVFIARKLYRFFVHDVPNENHIGAIAKVFYDSKYDIKKTLTAIFTAPWFYEEKNIGTHIKSPIELWVGIRRILPMTLSNPPTALIFQRALGQILFFPPNVAGWPGGKNWIDSSTLLLRLRLPQMLTAGEPISIATKSDDDVQMGMMMEDKKRQAQKKAFTNRFGTANIDWTIVFKLFANVPREQLLQSIAALLLQTPNRVSDTVIKKYVDNSSREKYIQSAIIQFMSTPEYQLT